MTLLSPPQPGQLFAGRYRLGHLLRSTPLAHVYTAYEPSRARTVQLTIGRAEPVRALHPEESQRMLAAAIRSAARAPAVAGLPRLWAYGRDSWAGEQVQWMSGALAPGEALGAYRRPDGLDDRQWEELVLNAARQLAATLRRLHAARVVHAGLGPESVLIAGSRPSDVAVTLVDIGPAPELLREEKEHVDKALWRRWATASMYAAPEVEAGGEPDERSDVYGFGLVLSVLLADVAVREPGWEELLHPSDTVDIGVELRRIAEQAMSERPAQRQFSFLVVGDQLEAVHRGAVADQAVPGAGLRTLDNAVESELPAEFVAAVAWLSGRVPARLLVWIPGWKTLVARTGIPVRTRGMPHRRRARPTARSSVADGVQRHHRGQRAAMTVLGAALVAVLIAGVAGLVLHRDPVAAPAHASEEGIEVPIVAGRSAADATAQLRRAGLAVAGQSTRSDNIAAAGIVLASEPAAGTRLARGGQVHLVVSSGPATTPVPELVGSDESEASAALQKAGLRVGTVSHRDGGAAAGTVLESAPASGADVPPGSAVDLVVASGDAVVPTGIIGFGQEQVTAELTAAGFTVDVTTTDTSDYVTGYVLDASPGPGERAAAGSTVTIRVANYVVPAPTSAPEPETRSTSEPTPRIPPGAPSPTPGKSP